MTETTGMKIVSGREILIGENSNKLFEGNILYIVARGIQTDFTANSQQELYEQLIHLVNGKISYLIDLNKAGKSTPEARKVWKELGDNDRTNKVALFGLHPVARVMAAFVMHITSRNNMRFFITMEEALDWIKE